MALKPTLAAMAQLSLDQEESAAVFGAGFRQRLRHVVIPMILPAAAAGGLMVFLTAFNELTVSALLWSQGRKHWASRCSTSVQASPERLRPSP